MSMQEKPSNEMIITSSIDEVQNLLRWVDLVLEESDITEKAFVDELIVAVDEAVSNIILHAYSSEPDNIVKVVLDIQSESVTVKIFDTGKTFEPDSVPLPVKVKSIQDTNLEGFGMMLVHSFMDEVTYVFKEKGIRIYNELFMVKNR
jgi:anti-sigma regulatory factor (Ser/Thr protein kinase)